MAFISLLFLTFIIFCLRKLIRRRISHSLLVQSRQDCKHRLPPGPVPWPVTGCIPQDREGIPEGARSSFLRLGRLSSVGHILSSGHITAIWSHHGESWNKMGRESIDLRDSFPGEASVAT